MTAYLSKKECRSTLMALRQKLEIKTISEQICAQLAQSDIFEAATHIAAFLPMRGEVDLTGLVEQHPDKQWYLPRVEAAENKSDHPFMVFHTYAINDDLLTSKWGISEPRSTAPELVDPSLLDIIIVPALAYTRMGYRLGYGKGFYDRYIAQVRPDQAQHLHCIGVVPETLLFDTSSKMCWPIDEWDKPVNLIVTESRIIELH